MIKIANNLQKLILKISNSAQGTPTTGGSMAGSTIAGAASSVNANNNSNNVIHGLDPGPNTTPMRNLYGPDLWNFREVEVGPKPGSAAYAVNMLVRAGGAAAGYSDVKNKLNARRDELLGKLDESTAD